ncbi:LysR family transcriptional regulator [Streptomyces sp. NPDC093084]|uniref:LysR family transcriptional regulator n=1 Tax=Streptomyces sp. NPDC093084 TaxID=3155197 RepID=UPI00341BC10A
MDRLETRELHYFLAVAEKLHFTQAAESLGIAQPVLSRAIARLERRMDVALLARTSRSVQLTNAGVVFLDECRRLLEDLDKAVRRTQRAAHHRGLVIAVRPGTGSGLVAEILRHYTGPETEIVFTHNGASALRDGTADAALLCMGSDDLTDLEHVEVGQEHPVALVPSNHLLAERPTVTSANLQDQTGYQDHCPAVGLDEITDMVALGRLITIVGSSVTDRLPPQVAAVPVADLPPTILAMCWAPHNGNANLAALVRSAITKATDNGT